MIQSISSLLSSFPITGKFTPEIKKLNSAQEIGKLSTFILSLPALLAAESLHAAFYEPFAARPISLDISLETKQLILSALSLATVAAIALMRSQVAPQLPPPPPPLLSKDFFEIPRLILGALGAFFVVHKFQPPRNLPRSSVPQPSAPDFPPQAQAPANPWRSFINFLKQERTLLFTVTFQRPLKHGYTQVTVNRRELIESLESYPRCQEIVGIFKKQAACIKERQYFNPADFLPENFRPTEEAPPTLFANRPLVRFDSLVEAKQNRPDRTRSLHSEQGE